MVEMVHADLFFILPDFAPTLVCSVSAVLSRNCLSRVTHREDFTVYLARKEKKFRVNVAAG
jgi:hypothetical protein